MKRTPMKGSRLALVIVGAVVCTCIEVPAAAQIRRLAELSVRDMQALDRNATVLIVPAGLFEEHGPYLPSFTDGYQNEWLANELAEAIVARVKRPVVMLPTIPLGVGSPEDFGSRRPFPGSYTVRPETMRSMFMDLATAFGDDGFRWIFVLDQHGSPAHNRALIQAADYFRDVYGGTMAPLTAYQYASQNAPPPLWTGSDAQENAGDVHAGASETSRILFLRPELVHVDYRSALAQPAADDAAFPQTAVSANWPGYFGSPRLATADAGAIIMRRMADDLTDLALQILDGYDARQLPTRATPATEAFRLLDENLLRRSENAALRQRQWLDAHDAR